jgi:hypothetical protein
VKGQVKNKEFVKIKTGRRNVPEACCVVDIRPHTRVTRNADILSEAPQNEQN